MARLSIALLGALCLSAATTAQSARTVLHDSFDNPASGWPDNSERAYLDLGLGMYTGGKYQMTPISDHTYGIMPAPKQAQGADVRLRSTYFMYAGLGNGGAGVVCRFVDMRNFYAFMVVGAGAWKILKVVEGEGTVLAQGPVKQVMPGAVDVELSAECSGSSLRLSVDGKAVGSVQDDTLSHGRSGLFVGAEQLAGTHAQFEDFVLQELGTDTRFND
jgi:hypothetical protein